MTSEPMYTNEQMLTEVERLLPCRIQSVVYHDRGEDFIVIEVNGEWMFRFPRSAAKKEALLKESAFLRKFGVHSPLSLPHHEIRAETCVGYRKIAGRELTRNLLHSFPVGPQRSIARQIGKFLSALHSFPLAQIASTHLTTGWGGWRREARMVFESELLPLFSTSERLSIVAWLREFFAMTFERVVVHGDFTSDHIICNPRTRCVEGIIDWGDVTIDDAATDLFRVQEEYGREFCEQVLSHWTGQAHPAVRARMDVHSRAERLFTMVYMYERGFRSRLSEEVAAVKRLCREVASNKVTRPQEQEGE